MKRTPQKTIDHEKLRKAIRAMGNESAFYMLDDVIELLTESNLRKLLPKYFDLDLIQEFYSSAEPNKKSLLVAVKEFDARSRAGEYYEDFNVNSKNCTQSSIGTKSFIADFGRMVDRCLNEASKSDPADIHLSFEMLFDLLRRIDECCDDIVFFADEGGAWQVWSDWRQVFPAYFRALASVASPDEFAQNVVTIVDEFDRHQRVEYFSVAQKFATAEQKKSLAKAM